jgi:glycerol-3-phosphate dehydrogenase (NAD+)
MWVFEELVEGKKLTEIINTKHENIKYLPGIKIPENIIAVPDPIETVKDASVLVFVTPHQYLASLCEKLQPYVNPTKTIGVSLVKGMYVDEHGPVLCSDMISSKLGIDCSVLMGANVADEVSVCNQ